jgi:hypothetical protein
MPNQWTKAKELGITLEISDETRKKLSDASKKQKHSEESKRKISEGIRKAIERNPDAYTSSNRGRTKQIVYNNIKFQGKWELEFYQYCERKNIKIQRSNEWFEYEWDGLRKYFPDFYLPDLNTYVEVKGYETDRDKAKWSAFPKKLIIIRKEDIHNIRKDDFCGPIA